MQIAFNKVGALALPFSIDYENIIFSGELTRKSAQLVHCKGLLAGCCETPCASCGTPVGLKISHTVQLDLSNGAWSDKEGELSDTMEFFDQNIDLNEVALSELELYLSDYFYCENCKDK